VCSSDLAGARAPACGAFIVPTLTDPESLGRQETCLRASAFHPDTAGHAAIFGAVRADLLGARRLVRAP
jgi:hypothetical protein